MDLNDYTRDMLHDNQKLYFMAFSGLKHAGKHFIPLRKQKSAFCVKQSCI